MHKFRTNLTQSLCFVFYCSFFLSFYTIIIILQWSFRACLMRENYFGVGWYLEFLKKDFRRYMRICWIVLEELEDKYIVPVCLSQLWSKFPQPAWSFKHTVTEALLKMAVSSAICFRIRLCRRTPDWNCLGFKKQETFFFGEISGTLCWVCKYVVIFGLVTPS